MRKTYLVCYDICNDKRLAKVHKTMRAFGDRLQYSVFECQLTAAELARCHKRRHSCLAAGLIPLTKISGPIEALQPPRNSSDGRGDSADEDRRRCLPFTVPRRAREGAGDAARGRVLRSLHPRAAARRGGTRPEGLYEKARAGKLQNFSGIDSPYEVPERQELRIDMTITVAAHAATPIVDMLLARRDICGEGRDHDEMR